MNPALARAALRATLAEALRRLGHRPEPELVDGDEGDLARIQHDADLATVTRARLEDVVIECRAALQRIADGTYGRCESCNERLPDARLKAHPTARYCTCCQTEYERTPGDGAPARVRLRKVEEE